MNVLGGHHLSMVSFYTPKVGVATWTFDPIGHNVDTVSTWGIIGS